MIFIFDIMGVVLRSAGLDRTLLQFLQDLRATGARVAFASNMGAQDKMRLWPHLQGAGEAFFCSGEMGISKPHVDFYRKIEADLRIMPHDIVFFDDSLANVTAAKACGWQAFLYQNVVLTQQQIKDIQDERRP